MRKVVQLFARAFVIKDGSKWHLEHDRLAILPRAVAAFPVPATLRLVLGVEAEMQQRIELIVGHHVHVAAPPAVAAAGTPAGNILLPPEGQAAVAAVACLYVNSGFVNEHRKAAGWETAAAGNASGERSLGHGADADKLAHTPAIVKLHHAGDPGEERIVFAPTNIFAWLDPRAPLAHDDGAARNQLPAEYLHAQALRVRIAPVFGTS